MEFRRLPLDAIRLGERRRSFLDPEALEGLVQSLTEVGLLHPLVVRETADPEVYELVSGERRLLAARRAGFETVTCLVAREGEHDPLQVRLIENLQREDLSPVEKAWQVRSYMVERRLSKRAAAEKLGVPRTTLTEWLNLCEVDEEIQRLVEENFRGGDSGLTASHVSIALGLAHRLGSPPLARLLLAVAAEHRFSRAELRKLGRLIVEQGLTLEQAVAAVRPEAAGASPPEAGREPARGSPAEGATAGVPSLEEELRRLVRVLERSRGELHRIALRPVGELPAEERERIARELILIRNMLDRAVTTLFRVDPSKLDPRQLAELERERRREARRRRKAEQAARRRERRQAARVARTPI